MTSSEQEAIIENYFRFSHNQPYSFFHEDTFRQQFHSGLLPDAVLYAVLAIASRFSSNLGTHEKTRPTQRYADMGWAAAMTRCFGSDQGPDHRMVQAIALLALCDFTGKLPHEAPVSHVLMRIECRHRMAWIKIGLSATIAQALHMMAEPNPALPWVVREERRRTFWSIYLLDKMATCGRGRPPIFLDYTCVLQLPGTESAFSLKSSANTPTLQDFTNDTDFDVNSIGSFARITVVAATLSRIASYTFQQRNSIDTKPPWDHSSDYSVLTSRLHWFAAYFETWMPISSAILTRCSNGNEIDYSVSEPFLFAYVLYQLCHCLLQHPFLLRRQIQAFGTRYPTSFFAAATKTGYEHAQELTRTLAFAKQSGHKVAASFLGYCSLVAASINGLYQYSDDEEVRQQARSALATNIAFLKLHAVYWPNAAKMVNACFPLLVLIRGD